MIWGCSCPIPRAHSVHDCKCEACGRWLDPRYVDSAENLAAFRDRLEALPDTPGAAVDHARQIRRKGLGYLDRNNDEQGRDRAAQGINLAADAWLKGRRYGVEEINPHLLSAARYFALAHHQLLLAEAAMEGEINGR